MSRVLIMEDDPDIRELLELKLGLAGFDVHSEADGLAGLRAAQQSRPELIILDWMMPGLNGLDVCRALRRDKNLGHVPVLMLSARAQADDVKCGYAAGVDEYILKPFSPQTLINRVEAMLRPGKR